MFTAQITTPMPAPPPIEAPTARPSLEAVQLAVAVVEAMMGRRPLHHLRHHLAPEAFAQLTIARHSGRFTRSTLAGVRCQMPTRAAAEVSVRVSLASRWVACVLRLDREASWRCTQFIVLGS